MLNILIDIIFKEEYTSTIYMDRVKLVTHLVSNIKNGIFVEIGTDRGFLAEKILEASPTSILYCIDPYISYDDYHDSINNENGEKRYQETKQMLETKFGSRVKFIRKFSRDAVHDIPNNIDLLYIDGNHQYSYVYEELQLYFNKVKQFRYIIGDDAVDTDESKRDSNNNIEIIWAPGCKGKYGVIKAFKQFTEEKNISGQIWNNQYIIYKDTESNNINNNDILFITAYKDINRDNWPNFKRTKEEYFSYFYNLASTIKYNLIVFVEDNIKDELCKKYNFKENIIFKDLNKVETFYQKYLEKDKLIMDSDIYKNKIPNSEKGYPEHLYSEYNMINHSKINFVKEAKRQFPTYEFYSWIDFGMIRYTSLTPSNLQPLLLPKKIIYQNLLPITKLLPEEYMLTTSNVFIAGSAYIIHTSLIEIFEKLYEEKINNWQERYITDDDQNLILQIYYNNPQLFTLIYNSNWFSLYNSLNYKQLLNN
jgi:predicted O-methyltransferase YrrM